MSVNADALMELYESLKAGKAKPTIREMSREDRLAYHAEANRRSRQRVRQETEDGTRAPTPAAIRAALADAALILLATGVPGSDEVQRLLGLAFPGKPGVPGTVTAKARSGRLKPKLLTPEKLLA